MSVSLVRRIEVPLRSRLKGPISKENARYMGCYSRHDLAGISDIDFTQTAPYDMTVLVFSDLYLASPTDGVIETQKVDEVLVVDFDE